jgi:hypothetical protein
MSHVAGKRKQEVNYHIAGKRKHVLEGRESPLQKVCPKKSKVLPGPRRPCEPPPRRIIAAKGTVARSMAASSSRAVTPKFMKEELVEGEVLDEEMVETEVVEEEMEEEEQEELWEEPFYDERERASRQVDCLEKAEHHGKWEEQYETEKHQCQVDLEGKLAKVNELVASISKQEARLAREQARLAREQANLAQDKEDMELHNMEAEALHKKHLKAEKKEEEHRSRRQYWEAQMLGENEGENPRYY